MASSLSKWTATFVHIFSQYKFLFLVAHDRSGHLTENYRVVPAPTSRTMHRLIAAVLALLQGMAILACPQKSEEVMRSRRSIIGVPSFVGGRFGQDQQRSVVGYDGQCRRMFEEVADGNDCCSAYYSASQLLTAQQSTASEKLRNIYQFTVQ